MTKYLLAAEADRIQDLLFRSSRLREVVGGSQLLSRFCEKVPSLLGVPDGDITTSGGGSFYVEFDSEEAARQFGAALAEAYNRATGGTLSVAEPVEITDGYGPASEEASERLRQTKRQGPAVMTPHIPHIAFCESCGTGLAVAHEARVEEEVERHYLCSSCRAKAAEPFYGEVVGQDVLPKMGWPHDADEVGIYDDRGYVAYIVADGDGMGAVFGECNREQAKALSKKMDQLLGQALAEPIRQFMCNSAANRNPQFVPALPLILGGDDLFALVPAPWALDIARRLCRTFQSKMTEFAQGQGIRREITMTAAVVICKANYPYYLAHQIGEHRLSAAKQMVKALAAEKELHLSAVDFEVVLGSQAAPKELTNGRRPTLRPYWATDEDVPPGWGLSIETLLDWRYRLAHTPPSRRRSQLRELFDRVSSLHDEQQWDDELERLLERIERDWGREENHPVRTALKELGGMKLEEWYRVERESDEERWQGHVMPDLLRVWEWALDLDRPLVEYEGGER